MKRLPFRLSSFAEGTMSNVERVRRWLFKLVAGVSVVLFVTALGAWARSLIGRGKHGRGFDLVSGSGRITIRSGIASSYSRWSFWNTYDPPSRMPANPRWGWARKTNPRDLEFVVNYWLVALIATSPLLLLLTSYGWTRFRRARVALAGHCTICGYDLRATPDRCPECGAVPATAKGAAT